MINYYFAEKNSGIKYILDLNPERKIIGSKDENVSISLIFKEFEFIYNRDFLKYNKINFDIYGLLFKKDNNSDEQLNTTSILTERKPSFINKTSHKYNYYNPENWTLIFANIPKEMNYVYDLQLQVNSIIENNIFNEEFLIFTTQIDLTDINPKEEEEQEEEREEQEEEKNEDEEKKGENEKQKEKEKEKKDNEDYTLYIVLPIVGLVVLLLVAFFIFRYIRLRKSKLSIKEDLNSMTYNDNFHENL